MSSLPKKPRGPRPPAPPLARLPAPPTLAALVRQLAPGISWEQARALCRAGQVLVDGEAVTDPAWRLPAGSSGSARHLESAESAESAAPHIVLLRVPAPRVPKGQPHPAGEAAEAGGEEKAAGDGEAGWKGEVEGEGSAESEGGAGWQRRGRGDGEAVREGDAGGEGAGGEKGSAGPVARPAGAAARRPAAPHLVVYADVDVVVVRKPAGVLTVPFERGDRDTLLALARVALRRREGRAAAVQNPTLRAVQRLDRDTSGLLVFARNVAAQRDLQEQLGRREVVRRYEALVHGLLPHDVTFDTWLIADRGDGLRGSWGARRASRRAPNSGNAITSPGALPDGARQAVTHVRVLERLRSATRISCELETGRQHQIRIHLAEAGHPLIGEMVYIRDYRGPQIAAPRPMLHAAALGFRQPRDARFLLFEEPPPADFALLLDRLRHRRP